MSECPWDMPLDNQCPKHGGSLRDCPSVEGHGQWLDFAAAVAALTMRVTNLEKGYRVIP